MTSDNQGETGSQVVKTIAETRAWARAQKAARRTVGFVPTMGALHEGHRGLLEQARDECGCVVASIFVNPTQFGPAEDYNRYPRTPEADLALCTQAGVGLVFAPEVSEVYGDRLQGTYVDVVRESQGLCGAYRAGHFRGVATVVLKLLNMVQPDVAYFGEKDYQQLVVIQRMVEDLNLDVRICGVPTVRECDGLALSSRNRYLSPADRRAAVVLWHALQAACQAVRAGERDAGALRHLLRSTVESQSRVRLQYAEVVDARSLQPLDRLGLASEARALLAAYVGSTRLIDNLALPAVGEH